MRNVSTTVYSFVRPSVCWQHEQTVWLLVWPPRGVCWAEWLVTNPAAGPCTNLEAPAVALAFGAGGAFSFSCQLLPTHLRCPLRMGEKLFCLCYTQGGQADCVATLHSVGLGCVARCLGCCSMPASCRTAALRRHVGCIYAKSSLSQCNQIVCLQVAMCVRVR